MNEPKNCLNCGHRMQTAVDHPMLQFCALSGLKCYEQRKAALEKPLSQAASLCDAFFSGWVPRPPSLWERIARWWQ